MIIIIIIIITFNLHQNKFSEIICKVKYQSNPINPMPITT